MAKLKNKNSNISKNKKENKQEEIKIKLNDKEKFFIILIPLIILMIILAVMLSISSNANVNSIKGCQSYLNKGYQESCLDNLAIKTKNMSICKLLPNSSENGCYLNAAYTYDNFSYCNMINKSSSDYSNCVYNFTTINNSKTCFSLNNSALESKCGIKLESEANYSTDNYCHYIINSTNRTTCYNMYYFKTAMNTKNSLYCNSVENNTSTSLFYLLSLIPTNQRAAKSSSINYSLISGDATYLTYINTTDRELCYYSLYSITLNSSLCSHVGSKLSRVCAVKPVTPTILNSSEINQECSDLPSSVYSLCTSSIYYSMANETGNYTYCNYVTNSTIKTKCDALK